jgi:hypothetical protein
MTNHLDVPRTDADEIIVLAKKAPHRDFKLISPAPNEKWELAVGVIVPDGLHKRALTIELLCHRTLKPLRENFKFSLFYEEFGRLQRVYQIDTTSAPIGDEGDHDWPHQHIGSDRVVFGNDFPSDFAQTIAFFCKTVNVEFEEGIDSPFEFKLRPS